MVKYLHQNIFQLSCLSRLISSRLSTSVRTKRALPKASNIHDGAANPRGQYNKVVDARPTTLLGSESSSSSGSSHLSNSNADLSSENDEDLSTANQERFGASKQNQWLGLDRQRLLAYKKQADLGSSYLASFRVGLSPRYVRVEIWSGPGATRPTRPNE